MQLTLTGENARTLRDVLADHLRDLRREVSRTEAKDFRHTLIGRQEVVESLLAQLDERIALSEPGGQATA